MTDPLLRDYLALLERQPLEVPFQRASAEILGFLEGKDQAALNRAAVLDLIRRSPERLDACRRNGVHRFTTEIEARFGEDFDHIRAELDRNPDAYYRLTSAPFAKDLGICMLRIIPAGAEIVELHSGIGRREIVCGGLRELPARLLYFATGLRGFKPLYQFHLHTRNYGEFHEDGFHRFHLRVADMLRVNPRVKGLFAITWFVDPALEQVSPRLDYLRMPLRHGARVFCEGVSEEHTINALAKSETRRKLHESGKYQPKGFLFVWARRDLIHWADRHGSALGKPVDEVPESSRRSPPAGVLPPESSRRRND